MTAGPRKPGRPAKVPSAWQFLPAFAPGEVVSAAPTSLEVTVPAKSKKQRKNARTDVSEAIGLGFSPMKALLGNAVAASPCLGAGSALEVNDSTGLRSADDTMQIVPGQSPLPQIGHTYSRVVNPIVVGVAEAEKEQPEPPIASSGNRGAGCEMAGDFVPRL